MNIDPVALLKLFGQGAVERALSNLIHHHVSTAGYKALGALLTAGAKGCEEGDPDVVATALTEALFSIH